MLQSSASSRSKFAPGYNSSDLIDGKYLLRKQISCDEISRLYLARNLQTKEFVHIRAFTGYFGKFISDEALFLSEMESFSSSLPLGHIQVIDWGVSDEFMYVVWPMERLQSIDSLVKEMGTFDKKDALVIIMEMINFLIGSYERFSEPHVSLGSQNIYINEDGEVRYADYGVAGYLLIRYPFFNVKDFFEYKAPEMHRKVTENADYSTDIFQLSCVLYKMLKGKNPEINPESLNYEFNFSREEEDKLGQDFLEVFYRMSAFSPEERYTSYKQLRSHLVKLMKGREISFDEVGNRDSDAGLAHIVDDPLDETLDVFFTKEFHERLNGMKDVSKYIREDIQRRDSKYLVRFLLVALLLIASTFAFLVKLTLEKT